MCGLHSAPPELKYAFAHPETAENAMQAADASDLSPEQQQVGTHMPAVLQTMAQRACRSCCSYLRPELQLHCLRVSIAL